MRVLFSHEEKPNFKLRVLVESRKFDNLVTDPYINNNHPASTLTDAAQHMTGKKYFCKVDCTQAYHCLQLEDQRSVEILASNFTTRSFSYRTLAQGLRRSLQAFSSCMSEFLDPFIKADQSAQYIDDIGIPANSPNQLGPTYYQSTSSLQMPSKSPIKNFMPKFHFGTKEVDFLGRTITPNGVTPQKQNITKVLEKAKFPRS